ncbi:unnamed protein product [Enterobius vermicularis]|uniref:SCHIP-1 domain-containing protein n=1 Tax=Enterobius vermicularis TaxID=51028 RepID=A0A0N4VPE4_ENTVE|nr:unnamed protein product [Enterobius vermicularis]
MNQAESCNQTDYNIKNNNINFCEKSILSTIVKAAESCTSLEQRSNTSSLESLRSPLLDDNRAVSTSCSSDSFEMSSTTSHHAGEFSTLSDSAFSRNNNSIQYDISTVDSFGKTKSQLLKQNDLFASDLGTVKKSTGSFPAGSGLHDDDTGLACVMQNPKVDIVPSWCEKPTTSKSLGSLSAEPVQKTNLDALRESIEKELSDLDTCLPNLDFIKLEEKLNCAAQERLVTERKLLGEQVRRRLALQVDELTAGPSPRISTRPSKSNLGLRLQTAMNLQVCYINGMESNDYDTDDPSDDDFDMPKSKSVPNLRGCVPDGSTLNASELRQRTVVSELEEKRNIFAEETKMMLAKAKQTARLQMELERLNSLSLESKYTRLQLSRTELTELRKIAERLKKRIEGNRNVFEQQLQ